MNFGKLPDVSNVDFSLPPDHPQTTEVLAVSSVRVPRIYLGATGWGNREWLGEWYPTGTPANEFLRPYARQFGTLEFNSTHYRIPDADTVARWYRLAADDFYFCPKVPQVISHRQRLRGDFDLTQEFTDVIRGLFEKLGPIFLQLPENYSLVHVRDLLAYLEKWPQDLPLHLEFRHPDFFNGHDSAEYLWAEMQRRRIGAVITDVAGRRDVNPMRLTTPVLVLRFVGNGLHTSDFTRAEAWVRRLAEWSQQGLEQAYIFLHQPDNALVPEYTRHWADLLEKYCGIEVRRPELVEEARQQTLF